MNKNKGIKVLAGSVVAAVLLILLSSRHTQPHNEENANPNNFGEAIASQFNDNIRDVSARLIEAEKKLEQVQKENKALQSQLKTPEAEPNTQFQDELEALKEQLSTLTDSKAQAYPMDNEGRPMKQSGQVRDLDGLLDKATN